MSYIPQLKLVLFLLGTPSSYGKLRCQHFAVWVVFTGIVRYFRKCTYSLLMDFLQRCWLADFVTFGQNQAGGSLCAKRS